MNLLIDIHRPVIFQITSTQPPVFVTLVIFSLQPFPRTFSHPRQDHRKDGCRRRHCRRSYLRLVVVVVVVVDVVFVSGMVLVFGLVFA